MKTRWESFVFILLMLLPAVCLLSTAPQPDAPVGGNAVSQPCSSKISSQTTTGGSEHGNAAVRRNSVKAAGVLPGSSTQSETGKVSK